MKRLLWNTPGGRGLTTESLEVLFSEIASQPLLSSPPYPGSEVLGKGLHPTYLPSEPQS